MLGTCTLCNGEVMIRSLSFWDAVWEPAIVPLIVCFVVVAF